MRLSEAVRLGSMLNPQGFLCLKDIERDEGDDEQCVTCALGAAMDAMGIQVGGLDPMGRLENLFPRIADEFVPTLYELARVTVDHEMPMTPDTLGGYISCLNDTGYYSREWIADWLVESGNDIESIAEAPSPVKVYAEIGSTCSC